MNIKLIPCIHVLLIKIKGDVMESIIILIIAKKNKI